VSTVTFVSQKFQEFAGATTKDAAERESDARLAARTMDSSRPRVNSKLKFHSAEARLNCAVADQHIDVHQTVTAGVGNGAQRWEGEYDARSRKTTLERELPKPEQRVVRPGIVLLRAATKDGGLVIEY
jgi:hypothetical protein